MTSASTSDDKGGSVTSRVLERLNAREARANAPLFDPVRWVAIIGNRVVEERDLICATWVLVAIQPLVLAHPVLGRPDLGPWVTLCVSVVGLLRGRRLGFAPHPMLSEHTGRNALFLLRLVVGITPWALLGWYDVGRGNGDASWAELLGAAVVWSAVLLLLRVVADAATRTAWNPPRRDDVLAWSRTGAVLVAAAALAGSLDSGIGCMGLVGLDFVAIGLITGNPRNRAQRAVMVEAMRSERAKSDAAPERSSGDGRSEPTYAERLADRLYSMAELGLPIAMLLLAIILLVFHSARDSGGFFAAPWALGEMDITSFTLFIAAGAAATWPKRVPVARACVLHEVVATGGLDALTRGAARPFDQPPAGALRFHPLRVRRTRVMHMWWVPIGHRRVGRQDDDYIPLWDRPLPAPAPNVLGEVSFEPDALIRGPQCDRITVRLQASREMGALMGEARFARRGVVLRAFPGWVAWLLDAPPKTYRWEQSFPRGAVQVIEADTTRVVLRHGDILLLSVEGVGRAFEVELGALVYPEQAPVAFPAPQLEDYVRLDS